MHTMMLELPLSLCLWSTSTPLHGQAMLRVDARVQP